MYWEPSLRGISADTTEESADSIVFHGFSGEDRFTSSRPMRDGEYSTARVTSGGTVRDVAAGRYRDSARRDHVPDLPAVGNRDSAQSCDTLSAVYRSGSIITRMCVSSSLLYLRRDSFIISNVTLFNNYKIIQEI